MRSLKDGRGKRKIVGRGLCARQETAEYGVRDSITSRVRRARGDANPHWRLCAGSPVTIDSAPPRRSPGSLPGDKGRDPLSSLVRGS